MSSIDRGESPFSQACSAGPSDASGTSVDLSVVIPALDEGENLATLLPELRETLVALGLRAEILVVTRAADELTSTAAAGASAQTLIQTRPGYGGALLTAFQRARGRFVLTMDADLSHPPAVLRDMWTQRHAADVLIASRYVSGGSASMPLS
jgi:dolichol-phosphate mannosyltransferase